MQICNYPSTSLELRYRFSAQVEDARCPMRIYLLYRKQWERELSSSKLSARALYSSCESGAREQQMQSVNMPSSSSSSPQERLEEQLAALLADCKAPNPPLPANSIQRSESTSHCSQARAPETNVDRIRMNGAVGDKRNEKGPSAKRRRTELSDADAAELLTSGSAIDMAQLQPSVVRVQQSGGSGGHVQMQVQVKPLRTEANAKTKATRTPPAGGRELPRAICFRVMAEQPTRTQRPTRRAGGCVAPRAGGGGVPTPSRSESVPHSNAHSSDRSMDAGVDVGEKTPPPAYVSDLLVHISNNVSTVPRGPSLKARRNRAGQHRAHKFSRSARN